MSDSLWPHGLCHARLPCPSLCPGACWNSYPLNHDVIQPSHPLSPLLLLPSIFLSIRVFSNESALHIRRPKYWKFSFSTSPSNEYSELIFFRIDWFDLFTISGTLKSPLQYHRSKAISSSVLSLLYGLSHPYMTTGKTIALTYWTCWQNNVFPF